MQHLEEQENINPNNFKPPHQSSSNQVDPKQQAPPSRLIFQCEICSEHMTRAEIQDHVKSHSLESIKNHCVTRVGKKQKTLGDQHHQPAIPLIKIEDDEIRCHIQSQPDDPDSSLSSTGQPLQFINPFHPQLQLTQLPPSLNHMFAMGQYGGPANAPAYFVYHPQLGLSMGGMGPGGNAAQFPPQFHPSMYPFLNPSMLFQQHQHSLQHQQPPNPQGFQIQPQLFQLQQHQRNTPDQISITKTSASFQTVFTPGKENLQYPPPENEQIPPPPSSPILLWNESSIQHLDHPICETIMKLSEDTPEAKENWSRKRKHGDQSPPPSFIASMSTMSSPIGSPPPDQGHVLPEHDDGEEEVTLAEPTSRTPPRTEIIREIVYGCDLCDSAFSSTIELVSHVNSSHKILTVQCSLCEKKFYDKRSKTIHESAVHNIIKPNSKRKANHENPPAHRLPIIKKIQPSSKRNSPLHETNKSPQTQTDLIDATANANKNPVHSEKSAKSRTVNSSITEGPAQTKSSKPDPGIKEPLPSLKFSASSAFNIYSEAAKKSPKLIINQEQPSNSSPRFNSDFKIPKKKPINPENPVINKNAPYAAITTVNITPHVVTAANAVAAAAAILVIACEYCDREFRDSKGLRLHAKFCRIRFLHEQTDILQ